MTDKIEISGTDISTQKRLTRTKRSRKSTFSRKSLRLVTLYPEYVTGNESEKKEQKHVFLYLRPTAISYDDKADNTAVVQVNKTYEIHLSHATTQITRLSDNCKEQNVSMFNVQQFVVEKPTFSMTMRQDNIGDILAFSDYPLVLTLRGVEEEYDDELIKSGIMNSVLQRDDNDDTRKKQRSHILAQGYMDLLQLFLKKRTNATLSVFLYPVNPDLNSRTCKMKWDIYTLMPLLKNLKFSNAIFLSFTSIFNASKDIIPNDCTDLTATLSFKSNQLNNESGQYDKIFICQYSGFMRDVINQQFQCYKWENLRRHRCTDFNNLGINTSLGFNVHKIFGHILGTEYVNFDFKNIDLNKHKALICNSLHRFILTSEMHINLERYLINHQPEILVEIFNQSDPQKILLEGTIDLSIFLYPEVKSVSFAVALKTPEQQYVNFQEEQIQSNNKGKVSKLVNVNKTSTTNYSNDITSELSWRRSSLILNEPKTTFAVIRICLKESITNPALDLNTVFNVDNMNREIYSTCWSVKPPSSIPLNPTDEQNYEEAYQLFDDCIIQLKNYILDNNIKRIEETSSTKHYFCSQSQVLTDRIVALVAHDFNKRYSTKTNLEFTHLTTTVYKELVQRVRHIILEPNSDTLYPASTLVYTDKQINIMERMTIMKYLYEIGQDELAIYFVEELEKEHGSNKMYRFYKFLYAVEKKNFELAQIYLNLPSRERDKDGEHFTDLIQIYINYMADVKDSENDSEEEDLSSRLENLITALVTLCKFKWLKFQTGWMLLYCIYKKCHYLPGMSFARYQFENLIESAFINLSYIPKTLWDIYNEYTPKYLETERAKYFWKGVILLLRLGLYQFAEWLYEEISNEFIDVEKYIMKNCFQFHLSRLGRSIDNRNVGKMKFSFKKLQNNEELQAFIHLIEGNILWYKAPNSFASIEEYSKIMNMSALNDTTPYQLGVLRYAYYMIQQEKYEDAIKGFDFTHKSYEIICFLGKAVAYYQLNRLQESIKCFAELTKFNIYMPYIWAYLALTHLKLGDNYEALECWRYAKLCPENVIHDKILQELEKIDYDDIFLYVDVPNISTTNTANSSC